MGKAGRWFSSLLLGKRAKSATQQSPLPAENPSTPVSSLASKEKRRWSLHRSATTVQGLDSHDPVAPQHVRRLSESEVGRKRHVMAVTAAADAAVAAAQVAAAVGRLTTATTRGTNRDIEVAAAIKIQTIFRSYLARRALCALKGLVKLQAMVRGYQVRKQATEALRCMQSLVMAQSRARAQRMRSVEAGVDRSQHQKIHKAQQDHRFQQSYEIDRAVDENVKIVEIDHGESRGTSKGRNNYSKTQMARKDHRVSANYSGIQEQYHQLSPPPASTDIGRRGFNEHFEEFSLTTATNEAQTSFGQTVPSYMANTKSSRAKARSQSAPRQRPDSFERQTSRRRQIPRGAKMQRSSSLKGLAANGFQSPWSIKLNKSSMSVKDGDCGSTSTAVTNTNCCTSLVAYEVRMY